MNNNFRQYAVRIAAAACFLFSFGMSHAQRNYYYISPDGNDANDGKSQTAAWKTMDKLRSAQLTAGSSVLFERGGTYYGTVRITSARGSAALPITFGAYGTGDKPVISGARQVTGWVQNGTNMWEAQVSSPPASIGILFINGRKYYPARYPNAGYRWISRVSGSSFTDASLSSPAGHWNGAVVAYKSSNYYILRSTVASSSASGEITINRTGNSPNTGYGYFFQNHLNAIDDAGEWAYANGTLTLYSDDNPNSQTIEFVDAAYGIEINSSNQNSYINIEDLCFQHYREAAISADYGKHLTIRRNDIRNCVSGIEIAVFDDCLIRDNHISDMECNGIKLIDVRNTRIISNVIRRIALSLDGGQNGMDTCIGILLGANSNPNDHCEIAGNRIDSTGYCGIRNYSSQNLLIKNNVVTNTMLSLADGGGIYLVKTAEENMLLNNKIIGNIVLNTVGNNDGTPQSGSREAGWVYQYGIYLDDDIANLTVEGNTVSGSGRGIFFHGSGGNKVRNNVLFNNTVGNIVAEDSRYNTFRNNDIKRNFMYGMNSGTVQGMEVPGLIYNLNCGIAVGTVAAENRVDSNYISAPFHSSMARVNGTNYSRTSLTSTLKFDLHSKAEPITYSASGASSPDRFAVLVYNPDTVAKDIPLDGNYISFERNTYSGVIRLQPFTSAILFKNGNNYEPEPDPDPFPEPDPEPEPEPEPDPGTDPGQEPEPEPNPDPDPGQEPEPEPNPEPDPGQEPEPEPNPEPDPGQEPEPEPNPDPEPEPDPEPKPTPEPDPELEPVPDPEQEMPPAIALENIPEIFTPNGDGFNETWDIADIDQYPEAIVRLYNRAKTVIAELKGAQMPWDGRDSNGNPVESGYYLYQIELQKGQRAISGYVTLLR